MYNMYICDLGPGPSQFSKILSLPNTKVSIDMDKTRYSGLFYYSTVPSPNTFDITLKRHYKNYRYQAVEYIKFLYSITQAIFNCTNYRSL